MVSEADYKAKHGEEFKTLILKQMLQRLPIAPAHVKAGNSSENLLNETNQIIYFFYQAKEIAKKACNSIMDSAKL